MEQLINVRYISSCGDNNLYTVYISRFCENVNYRRKYDPLFHFYYIFYISSSWVLILYKSIENWCYKQITLTPWRCVHFDFVPNFQCSWRDFERTGVHENSSYGQRIQQLYLYLQETLRRHPDRGTLTLFISWEP